MRKIARRPRKLRGDVTPPGDKSISHRAAIFNAIAEGEARIENYGAGADLASTLRVLRGQPSNHHPLRKCFDLLC